MNQLIWKEWRELRLFPIVAVAVYAALLLTIALICRLTHAYFTWDCTNAALIFTSLVFWVVAGAATFSQEIGSGTLQLISVMPISRSKFWLLKVTAALCAALACLVLVTLFWFILAELLFRHELMLFGHAAHLAMLSDPDMLVSGAMLLTALLFGCLSAGFCAAPFFDRQISAATVAIVGGIVYAWLVLGQLGRHNVTRHSFSGRPEMVLTEGLLTVIALLPLVITSYFTFTLGESLKSTKKLRIGAIAAATSCTVAAILLHLFPVLNFS